jgi:hypothetical protein
MVASPSSLHGVSFLLLDYFRLRRKQQSRAVYTISTSVDWWFDPQEPMKHPRDSFGRSWINRCTIIIS